MHLVNVGPVIGANCLRATILALGLEVDALLELMVAHERVYAVTLFKQWRLLLLLHLIQQLAESSHLSGVVDGEDVALVVAPVLVDQAKFVYLKNKIIKKKYLSIYFDLESLSKYST